MNDELILVVDDSIEVRRWVIDILVQQGFATCTATNGVEALHQVKTAKPDLMLLDLQMPRMGGIEVIDRLKDVGVELPIIVMTSHGSEAIAVDVFRKGVKDYIIKGGDVTPDAILSIIERGLAEVRLRRENERLRRQLLSEVLERNPIFISYSRDDWDKFVNPLVNYLTQEGFKVWVDQHLLQVGDDWMDKINESLADCTYMILCVSPRALASTYVKFEYRYFFHQQKPLIPLICESTPLPAELLNLQNLPYHDLPKLAKFLKTMMSKRL
ncbi:MAG: response regulator [Anaerolineaceae bacterium]|nr:response regulator [Anaerolineaceae bacterium]